MMPIAQPINRKGQTLRWGASGGNLRVWVVREEDELEAGVAGDRYGEDDERAERGDGWC